MITNFLNAITVPIYRITFVTKFFKRHRALSKSFIRIAGAFKIHSYFKKRKSHQKMCIYALSVKSESRLKSKSKVPVTLGRITIS